MHNKGSVLCLLVGWGANTPQLIMCLSVAVWAAAKGIRSSICECCSPRSRTPRHASQISSFLKREGKKTNMLNKWREIAVEAYLIFNVTILWVFMYV